MLLAMAALVEDHAGDLGELDATEEVFGPVVSVRSFGTED